MNRESRLFVQKIGKAFDQFTYQLTEQSLQIHSLSTQLQERKGRKRTKVLIDSNSTFASIKSIKESQERIAAQQEAWNRVDRSKEAQKLSQALQKTQLESLCTNWHVNEVADDAVQE